MIRECLRDIQREIKGFKLDAEASHEIRDKQARLLQEQKLVELRMLMRWDSLNQNMDKILGWVERRGNGKQRDITGR